MTGCKTHPEFDCSIFDGEFCRVIAAVDEPCEFDYKKSVKTMRQKIIDRLKGKDKKVGRDGLIA